VLCDVRERERNPDANQCRTLEIPQAGRIGRAPGQDDLVERVHGRLRHPHVDTTVHRNDGPGIPALGRDRNWDVARRRTGCRRVRCLLRRADESRRLRERVGGQVL
jgi:hypothetical protein